MKRKSIRKFAEHGGTARILAAVSFRVLRPILVFLAVLGSLVWVPLTSIAHEALTANGAGALSFAASPIGMGVLKSVITRQQGPEVEQVLTFAPNSILSTPTALKTDRKIALFYLHFRGRLTNTANAPTFRSGPAILNAAGQAGLAGTPAAFYSTPLFALIQNVTVRGTHARYGAQQPMVMRGETIAEMMAFFYPNYVPFWSLTNSAGGTNGHFGVMSAQANATIDVDFWLPIPLYPLGIGGADVPFYCLNGPDWAGNLYMDVQVADGSVLTATVNQQPTFSAYGSGAGSPTIEINSVRPLLTKTGQGAIQSVLTFHYTYSSGPTAVATTGGGSGQVITNLQVGRDTARIFTKTGVLQANVTAGSIAYASLSDAIFTRTFPAMDNRPVRFSGANSYGGIQDLEALLIGRSAQQGYQVIDFISSLGSESVANPKAAFPASTLTADRLWQLQGDVTQTANAGVEVVQVSQLGAPGLATGA